MRLPLYILVSALTLGLFSHCTSPQWVGGKPWQEEVNRELRVLGERNWIVIAEPSFSSLSGAGARTVIADEDSTEILYYVLETLDAQSHANPKIQIPLELAYVDDDYAPGVSKFRKKLDKLLLGRNTLEARHETLRTLMMDASKNYTVLVIKSSTALPFSNIFIELDSGYWNSESQSHLRDKMKNAAPAATENSPQASPENGKAASPDPSQLKGISI